MVVAVDLLAGAGVLAGLVATVCAALAVAPLVGAGFLGTIAVAGGDGRTLPALVVAQAATRPSVATLVVTPQSDGSVRATLERGAGATLDDQSTIAATRTRLTSDESRLAVLAGNLASRSGLDPVPDLDAFDIGFVVVAAPDADASEAQRDVRTRVREGLDATAALVPSGDTRSGETLWRYPEADEGAGVSADRGPVATTLLIALAVVVGAALLLAVPTRRRRRATPETALPGDDPADTFSEDEE